MSESYYLDQLVLWINTGLDLPAAKDMAEFHTRLAFGESSLDTGEFQKDWEEDREGDYR